MAINYKNNNWYHCACGGRQERLVTEIPEKSKEIIYKKENGSGFVTLWEREVFYKFLPNYYIALDVNENLVNRLINEGKAKEVTEDERQRFQGYFAIST